MPRQPRFFVPNIPQHVIQRGVNRQATFFEKADYARYLNTLLDATLRYKCDVHAYVLMTNHVHLLLTPRRERSIPLVMQAIGRGYVQRLNEQYGRTGTLWEGRYRASLVQSDRYFLTCHRYIEMNPVRAGMVSSPDEYPYSSFGANALGRFDPLVDHHDVYLELGTYAEGRRSQYRSLFDSEIPKRQLDAIRRTTNSCRVLGDDAFMDKVEAVIGRSVRPPRMGRRAKK